MSSLSDLQDGEFEARVASVDYPVLLEFWAAWCGPCRKFAPVVGEIVHEFKDRFRFLRVNTDENGELPQRCDVTSIPTLILYASGKEIARFVGKQSAEDLRAGLTAALGKIESVGKDESF